MGHQQWFSFLVTILMVTPLLAVQDGTRAEEDPTFVETKSGPIVGIIGKSASGKEVNVYYGIPYAQPPTGELRFRAPVKVTPWNTPLRATEPQLMCYQQFPRGSKYESLQVFKLMKQFVQRPWSEDCLTLNVWSPSPKVQNAPVVAYIHGGAFIIGSAHMMTDGYTLASEGAVFVSFNYRLAVFGFFGLGNNDAPGNVGLLDQHLALKWIQENIEAFGGNPNLVTLMGISAGSASVGFHVLSPMSKGLFARAIMSSGSPINPWSIKEPEDSLTRAKMVLDDLGCSSVNLTLGLACIRQKDPQDIIDASSSMDIVDSKNFVPSVDGQFVVEHPEVSLAAGRVNNVPVMISSTVDEGGMFLVLNLKHKDGRIFKRDFRKIIRLMDDTLTDSQLSVLEILYLDGNNKEDPFLLRTAAKDIYSDLLFVCGINEFADKVSQAGVPVYRYVFGHNLAPSVMLGTDWLGSLHGTDLMPIIVPQEMFNMLPENHQDLAISKRFLGHIMNFVIGGDPSLDKALNPGELSWPLYNKGRRQYFFASNSTIIPGIRDRECRIWNSVLPELAAKNNPGKRCDSSKSKDDSLPQHVNTMKEAGQKLKEAGKDPKKTNKPKAKTTKCTVQKTENTEECSKESRGEVPQKEEKKKWTEKGQRVVGEETKTETKEDRQQNAGEKKKKAQTTDKTTDRKKKSKNTKK